MSIDRHLEPRRQPTPVHDDWVTPQDISREYHVSRSSAYEIFKRLQTTVRIGGCVRARRSEIETRLRRYGRV